MILPSLRERLLGETLSYVRQRSPYYRALLPEESESAQALSTVPLLYRDVLKERLGSILVEPSPDDVWHLSSGTTTGAPIVIRRSREELVEFQAYLHGLRSALPTEARRLTVIDDGHGVPATLGNAHEIRLPCSTLGHARVILDVLHEQSFAELRCSTNKLKALTIYLLDEGVQLHRLGIKSLAVTGHVLTGHWRVFFETQWAARVHDTFSMSEFLGGAVQCYMCGLYHFRYPTVYPEIVDAEWKVPLDDGVGALVLTSLLPFSQRVPLIRYWTGDVVRVETGCARDAFGFEPLGRLSKSIFLRGQERSMPLLIHRNVEDSLDSVPEVARRTFGDRVRAPAFVRSGLSEALRGPACEYHVNEEQTTGDHQVHNLHVEVGIRYPPLLFPEQAALLQQLIVEKLLSSSATLRQAVETASVMLTVELRDPEWAVE